MEREEKEMTKETKELIKKLGYKEQNNSFVKIEDNIKYELKINNKYTIVYATDITTGKRNNFLAKIELNKIIIFLRGNRYERND